MKKLIAIALFVATTSAQARKIRVGEDGGCSRSGSTVTCTGGVTYQGCTDAENGNGFMCEEGILVHHDGRVEKVPMPAPRGAPGSQP
jgi:hypothetical protein